MGCCQSSKVYKDSDLSSIRKQLKAQSLKVEPVKFTSAGTLQINGIGGVFNPTAPEDKSWLQEKLTPVEFTEIVEQLNDSLARVTIGMKKVFDPNEFPVRDSKVYEALKKEVIRINARVSPRGVSCTLQEGSTEDVISGYTTSGHDSQTVNVKKSHLKHYKFTIVVNAYRPPNSTDHIR